MNNDLISRSALKEWLTRPTGFRANCEDCTDIDCLDCIIGEAIDNAPAVNAETVFEAVGLVKEAFDMAKSSLVPVVRCKDCKYYESTHYGHMCKCWEAWLPTTVYFIREDDDFCSYGEKRSGEHE